MADKRISELTNITGANLADADEFVVVDTSASETKAITYGELKKFTGTVTADGLTVDGNVTIGQTNAADRTLSIGSAGATHFDISSEAATGEITLNATNDASAGRINLQTISTNRLLINNNGDISFYEDTGTTPKFFWDASAESLGIGTSSPGQELHVQAGTGLEADIRISGNGGASSYMDLFHNSGGAGVWNASNTPLQFATNGTERMRIDASGNLLVGTTDNNVSNNSGVSNSGINLLATGQIFAAYGGNVANFNQLGTSGGSIINFDVDGTTVGSIGVNSSDNLRIAGSATSHSGIEFSTNKMLPLSGNSLSDGSEDVGASSFRFKDIYATNALIQTSDRNEKQDIAELDEAERRVAIAAKGLLRKFRWKDAVAERGDDARIHFGIIAQDLQAAFEAEGLDAGRYGMFIHSTWTDEETGEERSRMGVRYSELLAFIIAAI